MVQDFVKSRLPKEIRWGGNIDFTVDVPPSAKAVVMRLKRLRDSDVDRATGKVKNERAARKNAVVVSLDIATPTDNLIDVTAIPKHATRHMKAGIYFLHYTISYESGGKFNHGSKLYSGLQRAP